jgi:hypothetical protein
MTTTDNTEIFPCGSLRETREQMAQARACKCGSRKLFPVSDLQTPPTIAIACDDCDEIEGDAPDLKQAVTNWNRLRTH